MAYTATVMDNGYGGLNPVLFGYENCDKSHFFGPAVRKYWLIHYVVSGFGIFNIDGKSYKLRSGEMFVIPPFVETYYEADSQNPWNYIWIGFTSSGPLPLQPENTIYSPEALRIFEDMKKCEKLENGKSAFLAARLWDLFALLLDSKKENTDHIEKALNCIHTEYMNGITVQYIAKKINLNRSYFSALFKKRMGLSPEQYLINYRMNFAASLMVNQGKNVSTAAYSVGYTDIYNFSRMFKQHYGLSPTAYVAQHNTPAAVRN